MSTLPAACVGPYRAGLTVTRATQFTLGTGLMGKDKTLTLTTGSVTQWTLGPGNDLPTLGDIADALAGFTVTPHDPYDGTTPADTLRVQVGQTGTAVILATDDACPQATRGRMRMSASRGRGRY